MRQVCPELDTQRSFKCDRDPEPPNGYVLTLRSPDLLQRVARHSGFHVLEARGLTSPSLEDMPPYIPLISVDSRRITPTGMPVIGVPLERLISLKRRGRIDTYRTRHGILPETRLVGVCFGVDNLLERAEAHRLRVMRQLSEGGLHLVTSLGMSVYNHHPPLENLYNIVRSLDFFVTAREAGIACVPTVAWERPEQLAMWADWLRRNPGIKSIAIDLQKIKRVFLKRTVDGLVRLQEGLGRSLWVLAGGPAIPPTIYELTSRLPKVRLTNHYAFQLARSGRQQTPSGPVYREELSMEQLFAKNCEIQTQLVLCPPGQLPLTL